MPTKTVTEIHRIHVMNCQSPWHRDLLAVVAANFACVALKKHNALWLAGADNTNMQAAREMFCETLATIRESARDFAATQTALGLKAGRVEKVRFYLKAVAELKAELTKRRLHSATKQYATKRADFVIALAA